MREILFRGKRVDNGEWVEGPLISNDHGRYFIAIHPSLAFGPTSKDEINGETLWGFYPFFEVVPSTVGQYTGYTGRSGKKIFEGDVLESPLKNIFSVGFKEGSFSVKEVDGAEFPIRIKRIKIADDNKCYCSVIGNIYDNPELLEDKE